MISTCKACDRPFWRYRRDYPPPGSCSLLCHSALKERDRPPEPPEAVLREMYAHRAIVHHTTSVLTDHECDECERLEERYSASLTYHYQQITAEIVKGARS